MEFTHIVEQGEHLATIALKYGFSDWKVIFDHPKNKDLKEKRPNPNILFPGDKVVIPQKEYKEIDCQTGKSVTVKVKTQKPLFRVKIKRWDNTPVKDSPYTIQFGSQKIEGKTDSDGTVECPLPIDARIATLEIQPEDAAGTARKKWTLNVGDLDPVEEFSGQKARLANLGYDPGAAATNDDITFKCAVEEFQCDHKMKVDGMCGPKTQSKLKEIYGC